MVNKIPPLKKGTLGKYGYKNVRSLSPEKRKRALRKAVKSLGKEKVIKKVNAVAVLNKNKPVGRIFRSDVNNLKKIIN